MVSRLKDAKEIEYVVPYYKNGPEWNANIMLTLARLERDLLKP
jgi:hypothetical protein